MQIHISMKICDLMPKCVRSVCSYVHVRVSRIHMKINTMRVTLFAKISIFISNDCYARKLSLHISSHHITSHLILTLLRQNSNLILWQFWFHLILSFASMTFCAIVNSNAIIYFSLKIGLFSTCTVFHSKNIMSLNGNIYNYSI